MERKILLVGELTAAVSLHGTFMGESEICACHPGGIIQIAAALKNLNAPSMLLGTAYADTLGTRLSAMAQKAGIDCSCLSIINGYTPLSVFDGTGRDIAHYTKACDESGLPKVVQPPLGCDICYFDASILANPSYLERCRACRAGGAVIVLGCFTHNQPIEQSWLEQANIVCLDANEYSEESLVRPLPNGIPQTTILFSNQSIRFIGSDGREIKKKDALPLGKENLFGMAALLRHLFEAGSAKMALEQTLSDPSSIDSLLSNISAARNTPYERIGLLSTLHQSIWNSDRALSLAQRAMDENAVRAAQSQWKPQYHFSAPSGWINDPNGLIQIDGVYHLFYQLHPFSAEWGPMYWGHATSPDLVHWKHLPIALAPDQPYEAGCFSGSAVNDGGVLTLLYTAHNDGNDVKECQCIAHGSKDCTAFAKSPNNPIIPHYPKDGSQDFRDPKVWRQDGRWNMVVGTSKHKKGRAVLYCSDDLEHWTYCGVMCESDGTQGTMWECPNYCRIDEQDILILSPIGMKGHKNIYLNGAFNRQSGTFTQTGWAEIDHGSSFYAAQVFTDEKGRTILIAWMDMWGASFPSQKDGWAGALTLPRILRMRGNTLLQQPIPELKTLRKECLLNTRFSVQKGENPLSQIHDRCIEIEMRIQRESMSNGFSFSVMSDGGSGHGAALIYDGAARRYAVSLLSAGKESKGSEWVEGLPQNDSVDIHVYVDKSSFEVFIDDGAICFSQRFYPESGVRYRLTADGLEAVSLKAWRLGKGL